MIAVVDYGVGNLFSLQRSLQAVGAEAAVTSRPGEIAGADRIVLPGVGAFGDAAEKLRAAGLDQVLLDQAGKGKYILGICLGMQMLFDRSFEFGEHAGLGLIPGDVVPMAPVLPAGYKVPHIGWNSLELSGDGKLFSHLPAQPYVYFVHSYYLRAADPSIVKASAQYGVQIHASVEKDNVFACQFHPEKSGETGLRILKNFTKMGEES